MVVVVIFYRVHQAGATVEKEGERGDVMQSTQLGNPERKV
jgi:hypothetical protein